MFLHLLLIRIDSFWRSESALQTENESTADSIRIRFGIRRFSRWVLTCGWPLFRRERAKFLSLFRWERGKISRKFRNFEISCARICARCLLVLRWSEKFHLNFVKPRKKGLNFAEFRDFFRRKRAEISQKKIDEIFVVLWWSEKNSLKFR